jgi:3',5'-cyclic AMP phosphodiesterase CpdA
MTCAHADETSQSRLTDRVLALAHIGDLHITDAKQRNFQDFLSNVAQIEIEFGKLLDFVVLPGDNADNGLRSQYAEQAGPCHSWRSRSGTRRQAHQERCLPG